MRQEEMDKILEAIDHDDILERAEQLAYYFPRHTETINAWLKETYDVHLEDIEVSETRFIRHDNPFAHPCCRKSCTFKKRNGRCRLRGRLVDKNGICQDYRLKSSISE